MKYGLDTDLQGIISALKLEGVPNEWHDSWKTSQKSYSGKNMLRFFGKDYLLEANTLLNLEDASINAILDASAKILSSGSLCKLAWHCRHMILMHAEIEECYTFYFPVSRQFLDEFSGLFDLIVLISSLGDVVDKNEKRGIPAEITSLTFSDVKLWMQHYYRNHGKWGIEQQSWLINHFTNKLYRLGRLQFAFGTFQGNILIYRNKITKNVLALSEPGITFRHDGLPDGTNEVYDPDGSWISRFSTEGGCIKGNPISPYGFAINETCELSADEWEQVLAKGAPVLEVHIPEGGRMSHELCKDSMNQAMDFFPRYFSEKAFYAFACNTWLFDSQFQKILPADSNINKFQREFYLYPVLGSDFQVFERVFGGKPEDLTKASGDTNLQRAILDYIKSGNRLKNAAGFILSDELDWGSAKYQSCSAPFNLPLWSI